MKIETAAEWAIENGYDDIATLTSDEFVAWHEHDYDPEDVHGPEFTGVRAWRDPSPTPQQYRFVAIKRYENGEQWGRVGYGRTMLAALQDL